MLVNLCLLCTVSVSVLMNFVARNQGCHSMFLVEVGMYAEIKLPVPTLFFAPYFHLNSGTKVSITVKEVMHLSSVAF